MPKTLERDLGLYATTMISVGAMIGSGIFVLPGLAFGLAGPGAIAAYLLAGIVALPAVLSKAEMATAMPEAGGTYLYIDRAMGPLLGTIAGVGAWFSLTFKSAFALAGLGAYLVVFSALPPKPVALGLAGILLLVNVVGVKQSGRLQSVIVTVVVAVLFLFVADGITYVDSTHYHPFFPAERGSLLAATGFVFVSYAGVTKIASVAEEVENPGRNIPLAMLASILLMMFVYVLVVFVVVGVSPPARLEGTLTPMAVGAGKFLGSTGVALVAGVAVVALVSMANAGVLSASRFPFAMSRDGLAPPAIARVSDRFDTPVTALLLTGVVLLALVGLVPVIELAKLASAFKILVFALVNVALVAFRESGLESYDTEFVAPGYPWVQLFGLGASLVLLTRMGLVPLLGAVGIVLSGAVWYRLYGREQTDREGASLEAIRQSVGSRTTDGVERAIARDPDGAVLAVLTPDTSPERERALLTLAGHAARQRGGTVHAVLFEEVPEQVSLSLAAETETEVDRSFEARTRELADTLSVPVEVAEVVCHDARRAVANHADGVGATLLFGDTSAGRFHDEFLGYDVDWFMRHAPCDVALLRDRGLERADEVAVLVQRGPHGPLKVTVADAIARSTGGTVEFVTVVEGDASEERVRGVEEFHAELEALCDAETRSDVVASDDLIGALVDATAGADLAVVGHDPHTLVHDVVLGDLSNEIADELRCSVLLVHSQTSGTVLRRLLRRAVGRRRSALRPFRPVVPTGLRRRRRRRCRAVGAPARRQPLLACRR